MFCNFIKLKLQLCLSEEEKKKLNTIIYVYLTNSIFYLSIKYPQQKKLSRYQLKILKINFSFK